MLPVVDAFRSARSIAPPTTEKEEKMHNAYETLLRGILTVFDKYGFKEYDTGRESDVTSCFSDDVYLILYCDLYFFRNLLQVRSCTP